MRAIQALSIHLVAWVAFARCAWVGLAVARQGLRLRKTIDTRWGWPETLAAPEPFLMLLLTYLLYTRAPAPPASPPYVALAISADVLALGGAALAWWAFFSIPSLSSGHYVLPDQPVVRHGPYGWVRHPVYCSVFLIWLAVAAAFASVTVLALTVVYVVPVYVLYARSEEAMMVEHYGPAYDAYRAAVGMLIPRPRSVRARGVG